MNYVKECVHGNTFNCLQCEVKYLKYVIEELQEENEKLVDECERWKTAFHKQNESYHEEY
jgi:FtsZ-binding cell division protein ZapB